MQLLPAQQSLPQGCHLPGGAEDAPGGPLGDELVEFETCNPITQMMKDNRTGYFREDILDERVYSAILEFSVPVERLAEVLALCKEIAAKTSTVFSLDVSSVTLGGQDQAVRENLGLGRPLHQF